MKIFIQQPHIIKTLIFIFNLPVKHVVPWDISNNAMTVAHMLVLKVFFACGPIPIQIGPTYYSN